VIHRRAPPASAGSLNQPGGIRPGFVAITISGVPIVPARTASRNAMAGGLKRIGKAICNFTSCSRHAAIIARPSARVVASGFSQRMCFPAAAAARTISRWRAFSEQITTAPIERSARRSW